MIAQQPMPPPQQEYYDEPQGQQGQSQDPNVAYAQAYGQGMINMPLNLGGNINEQLMNTDMILKSIEEYLRSIKHVPDPKSGEPVEVRGKPLFPHEMIDRLIMHLRFRFTQNTILSNLEKETVYNLSESFGHFLIDWFADSFDEIEQTEKKKGTEFDTKDLTPIIDNLYFIHLTILSRSIGGRTQDGILSMNKVGMTQSDNPNTPMQDSSTFGKVMKRFGFA
jgi:hypothetical protein|tara:strand:- start:23849 stop:24514 length:666 start_codon:yes stop_codon:yes gene_type:complete